MASTYEEDDALLNGPIFNGSGSAGYPNDAWVPDDLSPTLRGGFTHVERDTYLWAEGNDDRQTLWRDAVLEAFKEAHVVKEKTASVHILPSQDAGSDDTVHAFEVTLSPESVSGTVLAQVSRI